MTDIPWQRLREPEHGDKDAMTTYAAVGMALSSWEQLESGLAHLFTMFVGQDAFNAWPAQLAYSTIASFRGRAEMLKATSEPYFQFNQYAKPFETDFKKLYKEAIQFAPRRNEIAHGQVLRITINNRSSGCFLTPAEYANRKANTPSLWKYAYTSVEIGHYQNHFHRLSLESMHLHMNLMCALKASREESP
jgi:hypothetical protein